MRDSVSSLFMKTLQRRTNLLCLVLLLFIFYTASWVKAMQRLNSKPTRLAVFTHELGTIANYKHKLKTLTAAAASQRSYVRSDSNHTYRHSRVQGPARLPMAMFNRILGFQDGVLEVEANVKLETCIRYLLLRGYNLTSCPDLKDLTLGGIVSGVGGGNTSFKTGYFHNNVLEMDVLIPGGTR